MYPPTQPCPRCQNPVAPGDTICRNCGLALTPSAPPAPPYGTQGGSYGTQAATDPYAGGAGGYPPPPPTYYNPPGAAGGNPVYPPPPPDPNYPGGQQPGGYQATLLSAYPGNPPQAGYTPPGAVGSGPPAFGGSQPPPGGFVGGPPPAFGGSQPQAGGFVGSPPPVGAPPGFAPPGFAPQIGSAPPSGGSNKKIIGIVVAVLVVLAAVGGGVGIYLSSRPKPTISVTSDFTKDGTSAGADGTVLHVSGQKFSSNSSITFLLDGQTPQGTPQVQSDSDGAIKLDLKVTKDWALGAHKLTAKDAKDYVTEVGVPVEIVNPGEAKTPGPNGAPTNSGSFKLNITITSQVLGTAQETLIITGKDDTGGTVCQSRDDKKTPASMQGTLTFNDGKSFDYTENSTNDCSGTYVSGKLTYTEMTVTVEFDFTVGLKCAATPYKMQILDGTFSDANTISGTFKADPITLPKCSENNGGPPITIDADSGMFTGTVSK
jgi:hypothetical protein